MTKKPNEGEVLFREWEVEGRLNGYFSRFSRMLQPRKDLRESIGSLFEETMLGEIFAQRFMLGRNPSPDEFDASMERMFEDEIALIESCLEVIEDREKTMADRLLDVVKNVQNVRWAAGIEVVDNEFGEHD